MDEYASGGMLLAHFVATRFIPNHVLLKSPAGRTHFHAILKHILSPALVDSFFVPYSREVNGRLTAVAGWPYLDDARLGEITPEDVRRLTNTATARGYSHQTVMHIRNVVGSIFVHANRERLFQGENPASKVKLEPPSPAHHTQLSAVQTNAILNLLEGPERDIAVITIDTGLTIPDICALQWKHINVGRTRVYVDGMWVPPGFLFVFKPWASSGSGRADRKKIRGVCISASLERNLVKMKQKNVPGDDDFVIADSEGRPVSPSEIRTQRLRKVVRSLGLPWVSWHSLRQANEEPTPEIIIRPALGPRDGLIEEL